MQDGRHRLVGVVDDDTAVRESLRFLLESVGFVVVTFPSASHFLTAADTEKIACLLVDQHMPINTGLDLLHQLRQRGQGPPVALMTGSPSQELTQRALALGAAIVLEKPLSDQALFQFVGTPEG